MRAGEGQSTALASTLVLGAALTFFACGGGTTDSPGTSSSSSGSAGSNVPLVCPSPAPECGGSYPSSSSSSGTSGTFVPRGQAIVIATLSGASCASAGKTVTVGAFADASTQPPTASKPVKDDDEWNGSRVEVACHVIPSGSQFTIGGAVSDGKNNSFTVRVDPEGDASSSIAVYVTFDKTEYKTRDCTLEYPPAGGVAAGRFWAKIVCPTTEVGGTCAIAAEVRLENCAEK